jgi:hypothetical protein
VALVRYAVRWVERGQRRNRRVVDSYVRIAIRHHKMP